MGVCYESVALKFFSPFACPHHLPNASLLTRSAKRILVLIGCGPSPIARSKNISGLPTLNREQLISLWHDSCTLAFATSCGWLPEQYGDRIQEVQEWLHQVQRETCQGEWRGNQSPHDPLRRPPVANTSAFECDERRPCSACVRHQVTCSLVNCSQHDTPVRFIVDTLVGTHADRDFSRRNPDTKRVSYHLQIPPKHIFFRDPSSQRQRLQSKGILHRQRQAPVTTMMCLQRATRTRERPGYQTLS